MGECFLFSNTVVVIRVFFFLVVFLFDEMGECSGFVSSLPLSVTQTHANTVKHTHTYRPRRKAHNKKHPSRRSQLGQQRNGIPKRKWSLPFRSRFSIFIGNFDSLLPLEQIGKALFRRCPDSHGDGFRRATCRLHDFTNRCREDRCC